MAAVSARDRGLGNSHCDRTPIRRSKRGTPQREFLDPGNACQADRPISSRDSSKQLRRLLSHYSLHVLLRQKSGPGRSLLVVRLGTARGTFYSSFVSRLLRSRFCRRWTTASSGAAAARLTRERGGREGGGRAAFSLKAKRKQRISAL